MVEVKETVQKTYSTAMHTTTSEIMMDYYELISSVENESTRHSLLKEMCNKIRNDINEENLIGLVIGESKEEEEGRALCIFVFPIKATEDNFMQMFYDEEKRNFYIKM